MRLRLRGANQARLTVTLVTLVSSEERESAAQEVRHLRIRSLGAITPAAQVLATVAISRLEGLSDSAMMGQL
jgi:hypothetical protein